MVGGEIRLSRWVNEICSSLASAHSSSRAIICTSSLLGRVESSKPPPLFRLWVSYLGSITAPWPTADPTVPHGRPTTIFFVRPLIGRRCCCGGGCRSSGNQGRGCGSGCGGAFLRILGDEVS